MTTPAPWHPAGPDRIEPFEFIQGGCFVCAPFGMQREVLLAHAKTHAMVQRFFCGAAVGIADGAFGGLHPAACRTHPGRLHWMLYAKAEEGRR